MRRGCGFEKMAVEKGVDATLVELRRQAKWLRQAGHGGGSEELKLIYRQMRTLVGKSGKALEPNRGDAQAAVGASMRVPASGSGR